MTIFTFEEILLKHAVAQGTVNFANIAGPPTGRIVDAPVFDINRRLVTGPDWVAQLYAGPFVTSLQAVGPAVPFMSGAGAGYFQGGSRAIPNVDPGLIAVVIVRAWKTSTGPTWETAVFRVESSPISVITGGAGSPPSLPADLIGLQSFATLPEPSSLLLAGMSVFGIGLCRLLKVSKSVSENCS